jgi:hypothetical protein
MLFADDLVLYDESKGKMEKMLDTWRRHLKDPGLNVSRSKMEQLLPVKQ